MHLGSHLARYIILSGYAIDEMAELLHMEEAELRAALGKAEVPAELVERIGDVLAVGVDEVLPGVEYN